jgi:hypothetical protein
VPRSTYIFTPERQHGIEIDEMVSLRSQPANAPPEIPTYITARASDITRHFPRTRLHGKVYATTLAVRDEASSLIIRTQSSAVPALWTAFVV